MDHTNQPAYGLWSLVCSAAVAIGIDERTTLSPVLLDKMNRYGQAANYPTVDQIYQCGKSMIAPRTTLDVALPPHAIDAAVFESYGEPASRTET